MLFLWIFGNNVEDAMGRVRFLVFYLLGGFAATALQTVVTLHWAGVEGASVPNIGASGAIAGVLGAYIVLLPHARVLTAIFVFFVFFGDPGRRRSSASGSCSRSGRGRHRPAHTPTRAAASRSSPTSAASPSGRSRSRRSRCGRRSSPRTAGELRGRRCGSALDELPPEIARRLENVAVVVEEENPEEPDLFGPVRGGGVHAGEGHDLPAAAARTSRRPGGARARRSGSPSSTSSRTTSASTRTGSTSSATADVAGRDRSRRGVVGLLCVVRSSSGRSATTRNVDRAAARCNGA